MGCVCGKPFSAVKVSEESPKHRELIWKTSELGVARAVSLKRNEGSTISSKRNKSFSLKENGDFIIGLTEKEGNGSRRVGDDYYEKRIESDVLSNFPSMGNLPRAVEGEQVAAGWPSWLVEVAGEAIRGWIPRKADTFEKLDKIGQGTYSSVYKGRDLVHNKIVALKRVRFDNMDPESVKFMAREILLLRRLDHPNIIKLEGLVASRTSSSLYLVFEYMEHDLTGLASLTDVKFTEPQAKCYMKQLLSGLDYCHSNGILHRDIKGSNLLIDNNGSLKIADFGLASYYDNNHKVPLTSRVVTLWYRPPELLLGATQYGVAVDLWSTGCILGELYTCKPIMPGRTEVEQLHKIFKLCGSPSDDYWRKSKLPHSPVFRPIHPYKRRIAETFKDLPDAAVGLMEILLAIDPSDRGTAASALNSEFFKTKPLACDPSTLPKYPPSKERDAKLREEEARRKGALAVEGQKGENDFKRSEELQTAPAPDANAERARSIKSRSQLFNPHKAEAASCFAIDPPGPTQVSSVMSNGHPQNPPQRVFSPSGPLAPGVSWRTSSESGGKFVSRQVNAKNKECRLSKSFGDPMKKLDRRHHVRMLSGSKQADCSRTSTKEAVMDGHGHRERKSNFSGPLIAPWNNIEQVLKEHDRRIQEAARLMRTRRDLILHNEMYLTSNRANVSNQSIG